MEKFILNKNPKTTAELINGVLIIKDSNNPDNTGKHFFEEIQDVELTKPKVNFLVTILSWLFDIFVVTSAGGTYKNKNHYLNLKLKGLHKIIKLDSQGVEQAELLTQQIKK